MELFLRTKKTSLLWAALLSTLIALDVFFFLLHPIFLRKRDLLLAALIWLALLPLLFLLLDHFLLPRLQNYSPHAQRNWFLLTLAVGILSSLVIRPSHPFTLLFPTHSFQVDIPPGSADRVITLEWVSTEFGDVSFDSIPQQGNWVRNGNILTFTGPDPASLSWSGRPGSFASLFFSDSPAVNEILIGWNGHLSPPDISHAANGQIPLSFSFPTAWPATLAPRILLGLTSSFIFLTLTLFLVGVQLKPAKPRIHKKGYWLLYTLPMITVWGIYLLTFWPGILGYDSISEWDQVVKGVFSDTIPAFHTLLVWILTRFWFTPTVVIVFQIFSLSLVVAWGIWILDAQGLPSWVAWFISGMFAVAPINGHMVVFMQKDTLYSICLLLLSLIFLRVIFTKGNCWRSRGFLILLVLSLLGVSSFRHNGMPVAFISPLVLIIFFSKYWRQLTKCMITLLVLYLFIHGPAYQWVNVEPAKVFKQQIWLHHIAAHYVEGSDFSTNEKVLYGKIFGHTELQYSCCNILTTTRSLGSVANATEIFPLMVSLILKEPAIEIKHQVCAGAIIWEVPNRCGILIDEPASPGVWINKYIPYFNENSRIPSLSLVLSELFLKFRFDTVVSILISPAIYFYLGLFCILIAAIRLRTLKIVLFYIPAAFQTFLLLIFNQAPELRYQYGVILIGLFSIGILLYSLTLSNNSSDTIKNPL
jgi:hypothetical protein